MLIVIVKQVLRGRAGGTILKRDILAERWRALLCFNFAVTWSDRNGKYII